MGLVRLILVCSTPLLCFLASACSEAVHAPLANEHPEGATFNRGIPEPNRNLPPTTAYKRRLFAFSNESEGSIVSFQVHVQGRIAGNRFDVCKQLEWTELQDDFESNPCGFFQMECADGISADGRGMGSQTSVSCVQVAPGLLEIRLSHHADVGGTTTHAGNISMLVAGPALKLSRQDASNWVVVFFTPIRR